MSSLVYGSDGFLLFKGITQFSIILNGEKQKRDSNPYRWNPFLILPTSVLAQVGVPVPLL